MVDTTIPDLACVASIYLAEGQDSDAQAALWRLCKMLGDATPPVIAHYADTRRTLTSAAKRELRRALEDLSG